MSGRNQRRFRVSNTETAIIAGGCFWCTEAVFRDVVGVSQVESGYIGGTKANPTYKEVCTGTTGHAEAIRVSFDPHAISLAVIYDVFLGEEARAAIGRWNADNGKMAVTTIEGLSGGEQTAEWYPAEDYHQEYWDGEGQRNPYCLAVIPPKLFKLRKSFQKYVKE